MRKYAFAALIILIMSFLAGCGSSGTNATVVNSTNALFTTTDISNSISGKTLYYVSPQSSTPVKYQFGTGTTSGTLTKNGVLDGGWLFDPTTGGITITPASGTMTLTRIQTETLNNIPQYWLVYDSYQPTPSTQPTYNISRLYFDQTAADAYIPSISTALGLSSPQFLMGGSVQGKVLTFTSSSTVTTPAGSTTDTPAGSTDSPNVLFNHPTGVTTDGTNLYVADTANHVIRKVVIASGVTSTIAGHATITGSADSADSSTSGLTAYFSSPQGVTFDGKYLYVTDTGNATIRRIDVSNPSINAVTTLAGAVGTLGAVDDTTTGANARFYTPVGITTDGTNLYVTDASYHTIRKIDIATVPGTNYSQSVTTLAGAANTAGSTDDTGPAARFNIPIRITTDGTNLYVTDFNNHAIRKITIATGKTTTIAGNAGSGNTSNNGIGTAATFYYPSGITTDGTNLYITEFNETTKNNPVYNNLIRQLVLSTSSVTTIAGGTSADLTPIDSTTGAARFSNPLDVTCNGTSIFVTNYSNGYTDDSKPAITYPSYNNIRKISP